MSEYSSYLEGRNEKIQFYENKLYNCSKRLTEITNSMDNYFKALKDTSFNGMNALNYCKYAKVMNRTLKDINVKLQGR